MVVLAVLLYCLVPSGCPIGHIVYLWTLTVAVTGFLTGPSGEIRTHGLMVPKVQNGVMVYHVLPHLLTAKPLCFQWFERFSI